MESLNRLRRKTLLQLSQISGYVMDSENERRLNMFYLKHKGTRLEIGEDNVYTTCPKCGKEHKVDICDILGGGDADLYGTNVYCHECSVKRDDEVSTR